MTSLWLWGPVALQMAIIFIASSIPDVGALPGGVSDKTAHFAVYAVLGLLLIRALAGGRLSGVTWRAALVAIVITIGYGASDEFHQSFVPGRTPDIMDLATDGVGGLAAAALALAARAILEPRTSNVRTD